MRGIQALAVVGFLSGCSNAPVAGFLDAVAPARGGSSDGGTRPDVPDVRPPGPGPTPPPAPTDTLPPPADPVIPPVGPR